MEDSREKYNEWIEKQRGLIEHLREEEGFGDPPRYETWRHAVRFANQIPLPKPYIDIYDEESIDVWWDKKRNDITLLMNFEDSGCVDYYGDYGDESTHSIEGSFDVEEAGKMAEHTKRIVDFVNRDV